MRSWEPSNVKPTLKRFASATIARAHWIALALLVAVGIFSLWNTARLVETNTARVQMRLLHSELQGTLATLAEAENGQRGYLLVGDESYLEPYLAADLIVDEQFDRVEQLVVVLPNHRSTLLSMRKLTSAKFAELKQTIELRQRGQLEAAVAILRSGQGKQVLDDMRLLANQIKPEIQLQLANYDEQIVAHSTRAALGTMFGIVLAAVLFVLIFRREAGERKQVEERARELALSAEAGRIQALAGQTVKDGSHGHQPLEATDFSQALQEHILTQTDKQIEALAHQVRELSALTETARYESASQSDQCIEALGKKARELATSVESSRIHTLNRSDEKIEAMGQKALDLAALVESSRMQTLIQSDKEIEAMVQQARDLAASVETSRIKTLNQSNREIRKLNEDLEQRVLKRTAQLEAANKELDAFSYSVSHDLRAPLRAIDGFSRIVLEDYSASLAEEGRAYLQMVRDNTRKMGMLVDDLLAFARLGRQALTTHSVDPGKMVRRCLEEMAKEQEGRKLEIVVGELPTCSADPTLLKQVWTNLLANALKYSRKCETARIEIGCLTQPRPMVDGQQVAPENAEPEVVYFVKDNGAGFDMKYVHKLFGVFQRLHRAADYEGTGVGLAIVQRIVHRHGGRIWADAKVGEGATFSFTLS